MRDFPLVTAAVCLTLAASGCHRRNPGEMPGASGRREAPPADPSTATDAPFFADAGRSDPSNPERRGTPLAGPTGSDVRTPADPLAPEDVARPDQETPTPGADVVGRDPVSDPNGPDPRFILPWEVESDEGIGASGARVGVPVVATAALRPMAGGDAVGEARLTRVDAGAQLVLTVDVFGLPAGTRGIHIHQGASCEDPGDHWNPADASHGGLRSAERHAGDLGNIEVQADGTATLIVPIRAPMSADEALQALVGKPVVIHEGQDDEQSDPSGDSGDPIACGILQR